MSWLAFGAILLALAGVGALASVQERADDDEIVEERVRAAFASVGERGVRVSCKRAGDQWRCNYVIRGQAGHVVIGKSEHPELSIIR